MYTVFPAASVKAISSVSSLLELELFDDCELLDVEAAVEDDDDD